jgi:hypothetical protein
MMHSYHSVPFPIAVATPAWARMGFAPVASHERSMNAVQVCSADDAEFRKRIIEVVGQGLRCELSKLYFWFQRYLDDGSERRLGCGNDIGWSKEPHPVDKPDQALLIAAQLDLVMGVGAQQ